MKRILICLICTSISFFAVSRSGGESLPPIKATEPLRYIDHIDMTWGDHVELFIAMLLAIYLFTTSLALTFSFFPFLLGKMTFTDYIKFSFGGYLHPNRKKYFK